MGHLSTMSTMGCSTLSTTPYALALAEISNHFVQLASILGAQILKSNSTYRVELLEYDSFGEFPQNLTVESMHKACSMLQL